MDFEGVEQLQYFNEEMQIEDDPKKMAENDIQANANKSDFDSEEVIEVDATVIEGEQQTMSFDEG